MTRVPDAAGPSNRVVVTAGHVDHGKSTLVRRLTGIDPDRLEEEKRRGLTIDLGYAWFALPSGREIGFVDVPGHERFVRTMLAGVGPVRLVLLVVAADEGWKPQSEEHLGIVDVLGVDGAVVALTKRDAVDRGRLDEVTADVRSRLATTALDGAPLVAVSALTGEGLDELVGAIDTMVTSAPPPEDLGRPRLDVDRVFTIAGAGTVVTGTLRGGALTVGDRVEISPGGAHGRIRGLQSHEAPVERVLPVARVAVNVAGVDRERIGRGDVVGHPGTWTPTDVLEARIIPVRGLAHPIGSRGAFTLHAGAAERDAKVRVYDVDRVGPMGAFVRIRLSAPLAFDLHDRFVLRESGRRETVAGGVVLDPDPPARTGRDASSRLGARLAARREDLPVLVLRERGALRADGVAPPGARARNHWWFDDALADAAAKVIRDAAERGGGGLDLAGARAAVSAELRSRRLGVDGGLTDALIDDAVARSLVERDGATLSLPGRATTPADAAVSRVIAAVAEGEPTPPSLGELRARGFAPAEIDAAIRTGGLARIGPDLVVTRAFVERAVEVVRARGASGATVSHVRQELGTSRRFAVPLMEHLDRAGMTRREGDLRFARVGT